MVLRNALKLAFCFLIMAALPAARLAAQNLTLEGQTGGFLTPTAYVVYTEKGQFFSHPVVSFHFIEASAVIGNIETFSITEGFASRAEVGYTRSVHQYGGQPTTTATPLGLSNLWDYSGMNVFHGKVVAFRDGQFGAWMPGIAVGGWSAPATNLSQARFHRLPQRNLQRNSVRSPARLSRRNFLGRQRQNRTPTVTYISPSPRPGPSHRCRSC